ncbi:MAG: hypothetical protein ACUVSA_13480 [Desulfosoma sp.]|uniref:hypothetical protein n=1 Tax=Desulfosoma sp. TaxID=2603217 RepID=UPI00404B2590
MVRKDFILDRVERLWPIDRVEAAKALGISPLISKPYALEKLAKAWHAVLHDHKSRE